VHELVAGVRVEENFDAEGEPGSICDVVVILVWYGTVSDIHDGINIVYHGFLKASCSLTERVPIEVHKLQHFPVQAI
jgi:hypothetical protein